MKKAMYGMFMGLSLLSGFVFAEDFSADMVQRSTGGSISGKIYVAGQKSRIEAAQGISIVRMDKNVMWVLMPEQAMYMEQALTPEIMSANAAEKVPGEIKRISMGTEMIDGKSAEKFKVSYMIQGTQAVMYQWYVPGFSMPVKMAAENGSWVTEYRNISVGPQDASLFELPGGLKKFSYDMQGLQGLVNDYVDNPDTQE
ncbi:MAG: hypothetical protein ABH865_05940 [Candidatus Omnitrophota bacterium]